MVLHFPVMVFWSHISSPALSVLSSFWSSIFSRPLSSTVNYRCRHTSVTSQAPASYISASCVSLGAHSHYTVVQKNAPTLADYNYDPVQSILIIFSKLFVNDHKIFHLTAHMLPLYLVKHDALFCTNFTAYRKKMRHLSSVKRIVYPTCGRQTAWT